MNHLNRIVISRSDYSNFYTTTIGNAFWTTIKERIINNNIIFIGYNFGDINIETILNSIASELGNHQKQHFLVAPDYPDYEIANLESRNIKYINSTGEDFVEALVRNVRLNIVKDYEAGRVGMDTINKFFASHLLVADFLANNSGHSIGRIVSLDNKPKKGVLSINADQSLANQLNDFIIGKRFGQFELDASTAQFSMSLAGIHLMNETDLHSLVFISRPTVITTFDISFTNGVDLRDIPVEIYYSKFKTSVIVKYGKKKITFDFSNEDKENFQIDIEHGRPYGNPKEELEAFHFLQCLFEGLSFTIFLKNGKKYPGCITRDEQMLKIIESYLYYFEMLLAIEKYYEFHFSEIDEITNSKREAVWLLYQSAKNEEIFYELDENIEAQMSEITDLEMLVGLNGQSTNELTIIFKSYSITIYNQTVVFDERILRIYDAEIINVEELRKGSKTMRLKSRTNKASDTFKSPMLLTAPRKISII